MARKSICEDPTHTRDSWGCKECRAAGLDPRVRSGRAVRSTVDDSTTMKMRVDAIIERQAKQNGEYRYGGYKRLRHCEICFATAESSGKPLHTDHDHETGWIRGTVCQACNLMLGHAENNIVVLQNAITYLTSREQIYRIKPGPVRKHKPWGE